MNAIANKKILLLIVGIVILLLSFFTKHFVSDSDTLHGFLVGMGATMVIWSFFIRRKQD